MGRKSNFDKKIEELSQHIEIVKGFLSEVDLDSLIPLYIEAKTGISNYDTGEKLTPSILNIEREVSMLMAQAKLQEAVKKDKEE